MSSALRNSKASYFSNMFIEVKKKSAYWNLLNKATKPTMRKNIGPLKRDDGSLIPDDKEKTCRINTFFATIGNNLINSLLNPMDDEFRPEIKQRQPP